MKEKKEARELITREMKNQLEEEEEAKKQKKQNKNMKEDFMRAGCVKKKVLVLSPISTDLPM